MSTSTKLSTAQQKSINQSYGDDFYPPDIPFYAYTNFDWFRERRNQITQIIIISALTFIFLQRFQLYEPPPYVIAG